LPWFCVADAQASKEIAVCHLLNQSSGLDSWSGWVPMADFDPSPGAAEKHAHALVTLGRTRPVGPAFEYSNANYDLLGLIVEAAMSYGPAVANSVTVRTPVATWCFTPQIHPGFMAHRGIGTVLKRDRHTTNAPAS
jgi:Beta-lactamase